MDTKNKGGKWEKHGRRTIMKIILTTTTSIDYNKNDLYAHTTRNQQSKQPNAWRRTNRQGIIPFDVFFPSSRLSFGNVCVNNFFLLWSAYFTCVPFAYAQKNVMYFFVAQNEIFNELWSWIINFVTKTRFSYPINLWFFMSCAQQDCRA